MPDTRPADAPTTIGVVVSLNFPDMDDQVAELVRRFTRVALETLTVLGAAFELFDTSTALPNPGAIAACDGLLLLGGGDIDARCYTDQPATPPNSYGVDVRADRDALATIRIAEDAGMPVLGICRGAQLINVHRGGSVMPDIADFTLHRGGVGQPMFLDEEIDLVPGSRLHSILGTDRVVARSGHHQAIDGLGDGLVVAARALDGIVEAVEDPERWIVGVQWHPEDDDGPPEDRVRVFRDFVEATIEHQHHVHTPATTRRLG